MCSVPGAIVAKIMWGNTLQNRIALMANRAPNARRIVHVCLKNREFSRSVIVA